MRLARTLAVVALASFAAAARAEDSDTRAADAAAAFQKLEATLSAAKTIQFRYSTEVVTKSGETEQKLGGAAGLIQIESAGRARLEVEILRGDQKGNIDLVLADGKLRGTRAPASGPKQPQEQPAPEGLLRVLTLALSRGGGMWASSQADHGAGALGGDVELIEPKDFEWLPEDAETTGLAFHAMMEHKDTRMVLRLDKKTGLPVRQELAIEEKGESILIRETYRDVALDQAIDPARFEAPAGK